LARLFELAVRRLRDEGVIISTYFYHDDPRHLTRADRPEALIGIRDLVGLADAHRLLVVGTADGFFHPISGDVHRWIHDFEPWSSRTVLSTRSVEEWTHSELQLLEEGFSLATARSSGLTRLADRVAHGIDTEPELLEGVVTAPAPERTRARYEAEVLDPTLLLERVRELRARAEAEGEAAPHVDDLRKVETLIEAPRDPTAAEVLGATLDRLSRIRSPTWLVAPQFWDDAK
jgi:hypothetical protein